MVIAVGLLEVTLKAALLFCDMQGRFLPMNVTLLKQLGRLHLVRHSQAGSLQSDLIPLGRRSILVIRYTCIYQRT